MQFKISTKEKFTVITPAESELSAILAVDFRQSLLAFLNQEVKNVVLNLGEVHTVHREVAELLAKVQQEFYDQDASFVICCLPEAVETQFDEWGLLELMNTTPTESEAWDIVQMEEIERDFLSGDE
jgi:anti-anti-sigma factor